MSKTIELDYKLLEKLTQTFGPSGSEEKIRTLIETEIRPYCDELKTDALGNLIAVKRGKGQKIMVASHMDEIGIMVTHIDKDGFLRFATIGGVTVDNLPYRRVRFMNGLTGVIGVEKLDKRSDLKLEKLFIDIGASSREQAEKQITPGAAAVFVGEFVQTEAHITSKALDDRVGCFLAMTALKQIQSAHELYFVFTVQEEVGLRGAKTSGYAVAPDLAVSVDVTPTGDTPNAKRLPVKLGKGVAIKVMDHSMITPPQIKAWMAETAQKNGIPYQWEILESGGNDGGALLLTKGGVPTGVVSIPTRYVHSPSETVATADLESALALLVNLLQ